MLVVLKHEPLRMKLVPLDVSATASWVARVSHYGKSCVLVCSINGEEDTVESSRRSDPGALRSSSGYEDTLVMEMGYSQRWPTSVRVEHS